MVPNPPSQPASPILASICDIQYPRHLCLNVRLIPANKLLELQQLGRHLDFRLEEVLRIHIVRRGIAAVLLDVQANRRSRRPSSREPNDDAAPAGEARIETLVGGNGAVEVGIGEVSSLGNSAVYQEPLSAFHD